MTSNFSSKYVGVNSKYGFERQREEGLVGRSLNAMKLHST